MLAERLAEERLEPGSAVLDLCTGSGVLAVVVAARHHDSQVVAVDVSRRAVIAAWVNATLNGVRVRAVRGDLFAPVRGESFDLIVTNPPYLPSEANELPRRGAERAWEAGPSGRLLIDRICAEVRDYLRPGGVLMMVHSSVCAVPETLRRLAEQGLTTDIVASHRGPLGPRLASRASWLRQQGLVQDGGLEELAVIRASAPVG